MNLTEFFERNYQKKKVEGFDSKFLTYTLLKEYLDQNFKTKRAIGKSFLGNEIYLLKFGDGKKRVLIWSQMHGNESTGTRAMLDVMIFLKSANQLIQEVLKNLSIYFIPILNPDGANLYTRRNAAGVDLNRDFLRESSAEIKVLKRIVNEIKPEFLFNLHDQRTIFNVSGTPKPATLSFLAPSPDKDRSQTDARMKSMDVVGYMAKNLEKVIPGYIARFTDEFYPTSTGDNFMKSAYSTILIEAGHFPNDYNRDEVRRYNALAILLGIQKISTITTDDSEYYQNIPENDKKSLDIILRNVSVKSECAESLLDIGIYFEEKPDFENHSLNLISKIEEVGDLSAYYGHLDFDMQAKVYKGKSSLFPEVGKIADFSVGQIHFENGKFRG